MATNDNAVRAHWKDPDLAKMFIELCLKESSEKGYSGASLKKESWDCMRSAFREKKNADFSQKQLKNQWEYLKKKYTAWAKLIGKTGNVYNQVTNTVTMSPDQSDDYIKANPLAKQFQYIGLQYHEELSKIFDGLAATGNAAWSPTMQGLPVDDVRSPPQTHIDLETEPLDASSPPSEELKQNVKRRKREKTEDLTDCLVKVVKSLEESDGPDMNECSKILDETLEVTDPLYTVACSIFCQGKAYKEQWLMLSQKPKEVRAQWIQLNGKKMGNL